MTARGGARSARGVSRRPAAPPAPLEWLFVERSRVAEPIIVELDRPLAFRPRPVGFWRGTDFHVISRIIATRREHDATYHRVMTDRGAFDIRHVRRMDPRTLQIRRLWELYAHHDAVPVARLP
jgi:hypothetical protein